MPIGLYPKSQDYTEASSRTLHQARVAFRDGKTSWSEHIQILPRSENSEWVNLLRPSMASKYVGPESSCWQGAILNLVPF